MTFNSTIFLLYFLPVVLAVNWLLPPKFRNYWLLVASIGFYAWGAPRFVFILAVSVLTDFFLAKFIAVSSSGKSRFFFWCSILLNLGLLIWFKYMNFFVDQIGAMMGRGNFKWEAILLPVGISFITFQKLSYVLDVKKKTITPASSLTDYLLYVFMFPQLLSGPITRYGQLSPQFAGRFTGDTTRLRLTGFIRFSIGLAKKVLVADVLAMTANQVFALNSLELTTGLAWLGAIAFTFQIYFDFSGYSDMAIGISAMLGFRLTENFNFPYASGSITEFWKRWHISLSTWLRDYLFVKLSWWVSRKLPAPRYLNIKTEYLIYFIAVSVTFLICGFWHGAAWTFVLWGAYQGFFLIIERFFLLKWLKRSGTILPVIYTMMIVIFGWVLFRAADTDTFHFYIRRMMGMGTGNAELFITSKFWWMLGLSILFSIMGTVPGVEKRIERLYSGEGRIFLIGVAVTAALLLFIFSEATVVSSGFSPFIYFRF